MMPEWRLQQVLGANSKPLTALVNNIQGWLGFAINHPLSVARIANINGITDNKPLSDNLIAKALSFLPLQMQADAMANLNNGGPNKFGPGLKIMMNPQTFYGLQTQRTPIQNNVAAAITAGTAGTNITSHLPLQYPRMDLQSNGIPIILTNSISNTEAVVA
jgi:hypothetical protein